MRTSLTSGVVSFVLFKVLSFNLGSVLGSVLGSRFSVLLAWMKPRTVTLLPAGTSVCDPPSAAPPAACGSRGAARWAAGSPPHSPSEVSEVRGSLYRWTGPSPPGTGPGRRWRPWLSDRNLEAASRVRAARCGGSRSTETNVKWAGTEDVHTSSTAFQNKTEDVHTSGTAFQNKQF